MCQMVIATHVKTHTLWHTCESPFIENHKSWLKSWRNSRKGRVVKKGGGVRRVTLLPILTTLPFHELLKHFSHYLWFSIFGNSWKGRVVKWGRSVTRLGGAAHAWFKSGIAFWWIPNHFNHNSWFVVSTNSWKGCPGDCIKTMVELETPAVAASQSPGLKDSHNIVPSKCQQLGRQFSCSY